jgi:hypothetical protein
LITKSKAELANGSLRLLHLTSVHVERIESTLGDGSINLPLLGGNYLRRK